MDWNKQENKRLIEALLTIQNADQAKCFLRDLMTEGERDDFAKRLKTAEMLLNKISYSNIEKETGFSSTTVARVSKWLNDGTGGYKDIIKNMHHNNFSKLRK